MSSPDRGLKGHGVRKLCPDRLPSGVSTPYAQSPPGVRDFFPPPAGGGKPTRGRPRTGRQIHTPIRTGVRRPSGPKRPSVPSSSSPLLRLLLVGRLARRTRCRGEAGSSSAAGGRAGGVSGFAVTRGPARNAAGLASPSEFVGPAGPPPPRGPRSQDAVQPREAGRGPSSRAGRDRSEAGKRSEKAPEAGSVPAEEAFE